MPANANEQALLAASSSENLDHKHQRLVVAPQEKIGRRDVVALIINRSVGSGIFLAPGRVLAGTGCVGGALCLWALGGIISVCGLYTWLECGLSMPQRETNTDGKTQGVPRSGGDKNYLEFMFPNLRQRLPHIHTTCSFAIMFILLYNLAGNAIAFSLQVLTSLGHYDSASGEVPHRAAVLGIAVGVLSLVVVCHSFSRKGGIIINQAFAVYKVLLMLTIIALGIARAAGAFGGPRGVVHDNFTKDVWKTQRGDVGSWADSLMLCVYSFSGFKQPFYVLGEVKSPRRYLPKWSVATLCLMVILYMGVNISYLLVVDKAEIALSANMVTVFFEKLFGNRENSAKAMAALVAVSIFGNLWVMTFTAARVKQEIAKEGILPWSLYIATSYRTPFGQLQKWWSKGTLPDESIEQAPTAAFGVHWFSSVLLIALVSPLSDPNKAYYLLVTLYSYTILIVLGCWLSAGLIAVKWQKSRWDWTFPRRRYLPWLSPMHVIIFGLANAFIFVGAWLPPDKSSPFHQSVTGLPWYVVPAIGVTAPFWGLLWYCGLLAYEKWSETHLVVSRQAYWTPDPLSPGEYIQQAEIVDHDWTISLTAKMQGDFPQAQAEDVQLGDVSGGRARSQVDRENIDGSGMRRIVEREAVGSGPVEGSRRLSDSFD